MEKRQRLGELLISQNRITPEQLDEALAYQKENPMRLGQVLIKRNMITEENLLAALHIQLGVPCVTEIASLRADMHIVSKIPLYSLKANAFIPIGVDKDKKLTVVCDDLYNENISTLCKKYLNQPDPNIILSRKKVILTWLEEYTKKQSREDDLAKIVGDVITIEIFDLNNSDDVPTVKEVDRILLNAYRRRTSDIHLIPEETQYILKYRIDGVLNTVEAYTQEQASAFVNRIKNMAGIPSFNKRHAHDGSFRAVADGLVIDMRVATMPTVNGEKITIRLLDSQYIDNLTIDNIGLSEHNKKRYLSLLQNPNGIFVITGPVGSGKSSTAHCSLKLLNDGERIIHSIEDPVEHQISGIIATQVNEKAGLTFGSAMRAYNRQDPDTIFLGETRDSETALIAFTLANNGKLILTTLHTNDSVASIARLLNLGIKEYQLIETLRGATAQLLVRKICPQCEEDYSLHIDTKMLAFQYNEPLGTTLDLKRGRGCPHCNNTGYYGRTPLQEVMLFSQSMKEALNSTHDLGIMRKIALEEGLIPLSVDGVTKVKEGITTLDEIQRVLGANMAL